MEFDEIVVKESPGLCRCCLSEGCYKDMSSEYNWMNDNEVYADMLLECFDISITQHTEGPNGPNRLICEVCITRLRDACNFKKQVLDSEMKFIDMMGRGEFRPKMVVYQTQTKVEDYVEDPETDGNVVEYLEDDITFTDDAEDLKDDPEPTVSDITVSSLRIKGKRGRPRKTEVKPEKKTKVAKIQEKPKTSKTVAKEEPRGGQKPKASSTNVSIEDDFTDLVESNSKPASSAIEKSDIMKNNVVEILIKSTIMPFRWLISSYRCFYCYDIFHQVSELKNHQETHTEDLIKTQAIGKYLEPVLYVDVSNLKCKLCPEKVTDLYDLIDHLVCEHEVAYNKDVEKFMVPFKLDDLTVSCVTCDASFSSFSSLLSHSNKDHKDISARIVCYVCGQDYRNASLLNRHLKRVHQNTGVVCHNCGEKFTSTSKLKTHKKNEHFDTKLKCSVCSEVFDNNYQRTRHMVTEHKTGKEFKCPHCPKTTAFRNILNSHIKNKHLNVGNHICEVCGWKALTYYRLMVHMNKHGGDKLQGYTKPHQCKMCDATLENVHQMKVHLGKVHNVEKYRIKCEHCAKVSTTKSEMMTHIQTQHSDLKYECDLCDYKAGIKWLITLHKRKHEGVKEYLCSICEKPFRRSNNLRAHMKVHTGVSGKVCRYCKRGFTDLETLKKHEAKLHYGEE